MDIKKLLIVDSSEVFARELAFRLEGALRIQICNDGAEALKELEAFRPDVAVLDLMMPVVDGLAMARAFCSRAVKPKILLTSYYMTPFLERSLASTGFDYFTLKPCDTGVLAQRICELAGVGEEAPTNSSIGRMLLSLQFTRRHKGFHYLDFAIGMYRPGMSMSKQVYPEIGERFDVRPYCVERDIRLAIQAAWNRRNTYLWRMYFGCDEYGNVLRPTNTEFIATLASRVNMRKVQ
ncbi:MAG: response regulator [Oscillospiraceae bacterium]|nr:response regulator [Oscillospiraceae bacterium]